MKKIQKAFIIISLAIIALPLVGMLFYATNVTTENRAMKSFPSVRSEEGGVNLKFFNEFEEYFSDHFAFRNELIYLDSRVQGDVFQVSSVDNVIKGSKGWLFYKSTLNDYLGTNKMTAREIYNSAHNIELVEKYVKSKGKKFVFTVPANKNTLYKDNMPYYYQNVVDQRHNIEDLKSRLEEMSVTYADLIDAFQKEDEVLYLKKDSHWNNKGALLAYNTMLDTIGERHDDYSAITPVRAADEPGDLNKMAYTLYGEKELNYKYGLEETYEYKGDFKSVEDGWIETECASGSGTILMFRDSFGNTLIPFFSGQFNRAFYTKEQPYGVEKLVEENNPDVVVVELVERNLRYLINMPPVTAPIKMDEQVSWNGAEVLETETTLELGAYSYDSDYYSISGEVPAELLEDSTNIIVEISGKQYYAFHKGENGYELCVKKEDLKDFPINIKVYLLKSGIIEQIKSDVFSEGDLD